MSQALRELQARIFEDGEDLRIDPEDVAQIRTLVGSGPIDQEDLKILLDMRSQARVTCPEFDELFFPAFKSALLADGKLNHAEQFALLRMLYGGGGIDVAERRFLTELRAELEAPSPEFEDLYQQAMRD